MARIAIIATFALAAACSGSDQGSMDAAVPDAAPANLAVACAQDAAPHCLIVDDAGVSHGCAGGGMGPGDRDDGGGLPNAPPPDAAADASNLGFGAECLFNAQCSSDICFDYRVKGQFCTQFCDCTRPCPAASLGCSGQGVCRVGN